MTLQNRVTPFGTLVADPARGAWMGNRGRLHDEARRLTRRRWTTRAWLICRLSFKGRRRAVMAPRRYTELFFLDEATALAAGHRPCRECRRDAFERYRALWAAARGQDPATVRAGDIDAVLHGERTAPMDASWRDRRLGDLPDGVFVVLPEDADTPLLFHGGRLWPWSPGGYGPGRPAGGGEVVLLTPPSSAAVLAQGYGAQIHDSAATSW